MMRSALLALPLAALALGTAAAAPPAPERDGAFFRSIEGSWEGPGEIIAGKFKGTKFVCSFAGKAMNQPGVTLDGGCRVGLFTQRMTATIEQSNATGYTGRFMDGAAGSGLDVLSGSVVDPRKIVLSINRNQLDGLMQARLTGSDGMTVTVSVKVEKTMVPVIGVSLKRVDDIAVGSIRP